MSVEELISIERVEFQETRERIQETYVIADLKLSKLFEEVLSEVEIDILPILNVKILLYIYNQYLSQMREKGWVFLRRLMSV